MSTETYEFFETEPARRAGRQGAGRQKEPNPFHAAVQAIAGTKSARGSKFTLDTENGETIEQRQARIRRLLTRAGKEVAAERGAEKPYRIALTITPVDGEPNTYETKFWDQVAVRTA